MIQTGEEGKDVNGKSRGGLKASLVLDVVLVITIQGIEELHGLVTAVYPEGMQPVGI